MTHHPLIHVGMHKTGSTLLQDRLFRSEFGFAQPDDPRRIIPDTFVNIPALAPAEATGVDSLKAGADAAAAKGHAYCISHERLSGYPAQGGIDNRAIAERLKTVFPEARILIFIREQRAMIRSFYMQYVTDGGCSSYSALTQNLQPKLRRGAQFDFAFYEYHRLIELYQSLFGIEAVMVVPFERLRAEPGQLARDIAGFAGAQADAIPDDIFTAQINSANPHVMQWTTRLLNGFLGRNQLSPNAMFDIPHLARGMQKLRPAFEPFRFLDGTLKKRLDRKISEGVRGLYGPSNAKTARMLEIDLGAYGYDLDCPQGTADDQ